MDEEEDSDSDEEPLKGGDVESGSTAHKKHRKAYSSMPVHPPPPLPSAQARVRACGLLLLCQSHLNAKSSLTSEHPDIICISAILILRQS